MPDIHVRPTDELRPPPILRRIVAKLFHVFRKENDLDLLLLAVFNISNLARELESEECEKRHDETNDGGRQWMNEGRGLENDKTFGGIRIEGVRERGKAGRKAEDEETGIRGWHVEGG